MPTNLMTPGVYIEEKDAFGNSVVAVETAVPIFIGYTQTAERNGKSLVGTPYPVSSLKEYQDYFGGAFKPVFTIEDDNPGSPPESPVAPEEGGVSIKIVINKKNKIIKLKDNNEAYFYNSIRLFYDNGGSNCFICSIGTYPDSSGGLQIDTADITKELLDKLKKQYGPTMVIAPDMIAKPSCYTDIYVQVLAHCSETQARFGIFDLLRQSPTQSTDEVVEKFRTDIGINALNYGAAYYPWLKTTIVKDTEVSFKNIEGLLDLGSGLVALIDVQSGKDAVTEKDTVTKVIQKAQEKNLSDDQKKLTGQDKIDAINALPAIDPSTLDDNETTQLHQSLKAASPTYKLLMQEILELLNELPPSGAIAGIYTAVDNARGVWKAPANVSLNSVKEPAVNISSEEQESLNIDVMAGKSINVLRTFPGIGTLVWGARTLDGNSLDWKYVNVRRTVTFIEQSIKLSMRAYVFEPNDNSTWVTVKSMINNFLNGLWKQGALFGASPEQAYNVQVGLGSTMTELDILEGRMLVSVKVALTRPAEFIVLTFQQLQQQAS